MQDSPSDYNRGIEVGGVLARLDGHDKHFASINGHLADMAKAMTSLDLGVQRLGDQAMAAAATVLTTASALKDADEARRDKSTAGWSPWARGMTAIGALATVLTVLFGYLALQHPAAVPALRPGRATPTATISH
jgi:hypothetical protein